MHRFLLATLAALFCSSFLFAEEHKGKDGKDDVMGAVWSYTLTKGDDTVTGQFRVYNREIFKGHKKVGKVDIEDDDETKLSFTDWDEMNGKAVLRKTKRHPPGASGTLTKKDGSEWTMKVTWKDG
jgi:hypothetical protein